MAVAAAGVLLAVGGVVGGATITESWRFAYDKSEITCLPYRTYAIRLGPVSPARGDYVAFLTEGLEPHFADKTMFTKQVIGLPGDEVRWTERAVHVGMRVLPLHPIAIQKFGLPSSESVGSYVLGPGQFFMAGTNPRAFDSRYYGPIGVNQLIGRSYPIW